MGGQGGYIRIQNKSSQDVKIVVIEGRNVDKAGMDKIVGTIGPGEQLPKQGQKRFGSGNGDGGTYQYIEGEAKNRLQKSGFFEVQAISTTANQKTTKPVEPSKLKLVVDHNSWDCLNTTCDKHSTVRLVADVDEVTRGNWKLELRVYDNYNPSRWMEEYGEKHNLGDQPLCRIGLPGTHDSATYRFDKDKGASPESGITKVEEILDRGRMLGKLNDWILTQIFERLCQCQSKTIREQLDEGIRYLDLRVAHHKESDTYMTCHGVFCVDVKEILEEIQSFLSENTKEIVIVEFKKLHDFGEEQHKALSGMIVEILGDKLTNFKKCPPDAKVQNYWDKGYQAVVLYQDRNTVDQSEGFLWPTNLIDSPWPNAGNTDKLYTVLQEKVSNQKQNQFFAAQGILTPDAELIKKDIMNGDGPSIRKLSRRCGAKVVDWVEDEWKPTNKINIVIVDFYENCNIIPAVINYNRTL